MSHNNSTIQALKDLVDPKTIELAEGIGVELDTELKRSELRTKIRLGCMLAYWKRVSDGMHPSPASAEALRIGESTLKKR